MGGYKLMGGEVVRDSGRNMDGDGSTLFVVDDFVDLSVVCRELDAGLEGADDSFVSTSVVWVSHGISFLPNALSYPSAKRTGSTFR